MYSLVWLNLTNSRSTLPLGLNTRINDPWILKLGTSPYLDSRSRKGLQADWLSLKHTHSLTLEPVSSRGTLDPHRCAKPVGVNPTSKTCSPGEARHCSKVWTTDTVLDMDTGTSNLSKNYDTGMLGTHWRYHTVMDVDTWTSNLSKNYDMGRLGTHWRYHIFI